MAHVCKVALGGGETSRTSASFRWPETNAPQFVNQVLTFFVAQREGGRLLHAFVRWRYLIQRQRKRVRNRGYHSRGISFVAEPKSYLAPEWFAGAEKFGAMAVGVHN